MAKKAADGERGAPSMATALRRWRMRRTAGSVAARRSTADRRREPVASTSARARRGRPGLRGRGRHVVDRRPLHVLRAEGVRASGPRPSAKRLAQLVEAALDPLDRRVDLVAGRHDHEAVGVLAVLGRQRGEVGSPDRGRGAPTRRRRRARREGGRTSPARPPRSGPRRARGPRRAGSSGRPARRTSRPRASGWRRGRARRRPRERAVRERSPRGGRPPLLEDVVAAQVVVDARGDAVRPATST